MRHPGRRPPRAKEALPRDVRQRRAPHAFRGAPRYAWATRNGPIRQTLAARRLSLIHISEPTRLALI
eukprot:12337593-Alexandrium_andersonii.AAC.1